MWDAGASRKSPNSPPFSNWRRAARWAVSSIQLPQGNVESMRRIRRVVRRQHHFFCVLKNRAIAKLPLVSLPPPRATKEFGLGLASASAAVALRCDPRSAAPRGALHALFDGTLTLGHRDRRRRSTVARPLHRAAHRRVRASRQIALSMRLRAVHPWLPARVPCLCSARVPCALLFFRMCYRLSPAGALVCPLRHPLPGPRSLPT